MANATQREAVRLEIRGIRVAMAYFEGLPAAVRDELVNTLHYAGSVVKAKMMADSWAGPDGKPIEDRSAKARRGVTYWATKPTNQGTKVNRSDRLKLQVYPRAKYVFMLGAGWRERRIKYSVRDRSQDVKARVARNGKIRKRIVVKGTDVRYRRHHLDPHPFARRIEAQNADWVRYQLELALRRGIQEAQSANSRNA